MSDWQVQDAIARFSELLNITLKHGPQIVTRRGASSDVERPGSWRDPLPARGLGLRKPRARCRQTRFAFRTPR
jgi:hypothetical protein